METLELGWVSLTLGTLIGVLLGVGQGGLRAGFPSELAGRLVTLAAVGTGLWLTLATMLAQSGALAVTDAVPPRVAMLALTAAALVGLGARSPVFTRLAVALPTAWPIAAQTFRLFVELLLHAEYRAGHIPVQMTWEGRNFDVVIGATAPLMALWAASGRAPRAALVGWNVLGLALLINVVGIAVSSFPGPLHLDWPGIPFTAPTRWPFVWLPAFLVPCALLGHLVSLRGLGRPRLAGRRDQID